MHFLWLLLVGFVIGIIAKMLTPGRDPQGCLITSGIGIAGSLIAKFLGEALNLYRPGEFPGSPLPPTSPARTAPARNATTIQGRDRNERTESTSYHP